MTCSKCGNELNEGAKFCTKCGSKVKVKLGKLSTLSVILISVGVILTFIPFSALFLPWRLAISFSLLVFFSGITLAFISLYIKKGKLTMSVGIAACMMFLVWSILFFAEFRLIFAILYVAVILAFILLYKKKHKIILIAGLAVIILAVVLQFVSVFRAF